MTFRWRKICGSPWRSFVGLSFCILGGCGPLFPTDAEATSPEEKKSNMAMIGMEDIHQKKELMYGILIIEKWGICHISYQGCRAEKCLEDTHSLSCWGHLHLFSCKLPCFLLEDIYDINWPLFSQCNRLKKSSWGKPPSFIVPFQPPSHFVGT